MRGSIDERSVEDMIKEGVQKVWAEEASKIIQERDAYWTAEVQKFKAEILEQTRRMGASPVDGSQQASCCNSKRMAMINVSHNVKKKLDVEDGMQVDVEENEKLDVEDGIQLDFEEKQKLDVKDGIELDVPEKIRLVVDLGNCAVVTEDEKEEKMVDKCYGVEEVEVLEEDKEVQLAVGSLTNIVAYATIVDVPVIEGRVQTIHSIPLGEENARVSITRTIQGDVRIPFPIGDEITTVQQAKGTFVVWPRYLIGGGKTSSPKVNLTRKKNKKKGG